jgi:hypothetical protein
MRRTWAFQFQKLIREAKPKAGRLLPAKPKRYNHLTEDELHAQLVAANKVPLLRSAPDEVRSIVEEVRQRTSYVSQNVFRDALVAAHRAGLHDVCLDIFHRRSRTHLADVQFCLNEAVVDSAYALGSAAEFVKIADIASERLRNFPMDHPTDIAMARMLWRAVALDLRANRVELALKVWSAMKKYTQGKGAHDTHDFSAVFRTISRFIRYGKNRDGGEMHSFRWLVDHNLLLCATAKPLQLHVNLLRSCKPGHWAEQAAAYYDAYREKTVALDEVVLHAYLTVLQAAKDYPRIAALGATLLAGPEASTVSATVLAIIAQAASEVPRPDVVEAAYTNVIERATRDVASRYAAFACLTAAGKCGDRTFMTRLEYCLEHGIIEQSSEGWVYLVLQHAVYAVDPASAAEPALQRLRRGDPAPSERIYNQLFQLYLRLDSPEFLRTYLEATAAGFFKTPWLELLITWADRRRYELDDADRDAVLRAVKDRPLPQSSAGAGDAADGVAGVRPMHALLQHDSANQGRKLFREAGVVADPPRLMDPRVHFLRTRKQATAVAVDTPPAAVRSQRAQADDAERALLDAFLTRSLFDLQHVVKTGGVASLLKRRPTPTG